MLAAARTAPHGVPRRRPHQGGGPRRAAALGLRTAAKPDSQDVCFITQTGGREAFLGARIPFRSGTVVDRAGTVLGEVPSIELVTVGQRRGLGLPGGGPKRYVTEVDHHRGDGRSSATRLTCTTRSSVSTTWSGLR